MTWAQLRAIGAPPLPDGYFYRVKSTTDGFVFVSIRRPASPPAWWPASLWPPSRAVAEVLANQTEDAAEDVREACAYLAQKLAAARTPDPYWSVIRELEGDHR